MCKLNRFWLSTLFIENGHLFSDWGAVAHKIWSCRWASCQFDSPQHCCGHSANHWLGTFFSAVQFRHQQFDWAGRTLPDREFRFVVPLVRLVRLKRIETLSTERDWGDQAKQIRGEPVIAVVEVRTLPRGDFSRHYKDLHNFELKHNRSIARLVNDFSMCHPIMGNLILPFCCCCCCCFFQQCFSLACSLLPFSSALLQPESGLQLALIKWRHQLLMQIDC